MKRVIFGVIALFTCTSINFYTPSRFDKDIHMIKQEINMLYDQGKLSESDINNLIKILE